MVIQTTYHIKSSIFVCQHVTTNLKRKITFSCISVIYFKILERSSIFSASFANHCDKGASYIRIIIGHSENHTKSKFRGLHTNSLKHFIMRFELLLVFKVVANIYPSSQQHIEHSKKQSHLRHSEKQLVLRKHYGASYLMKTIKTITEHKHYYCCRMTSKMNTYKFQKYISEKVHIHSGDTFPDTTKFF